MLNKFKYLYFLILPLIAAAVWYSPVIFKGYPASIGVNDQIVLGKNIAKTGMYAMENDLNVFLSSALIEKEAHPSFIGNKLTGYLYALVFKAFGFLNSYQLILFSVVLHVITLLIFAFLVFYLFNFRTSLFFSLIYIFFPFVWLETHRPGVYDFALFFISLFFLFYFLGSPRPSSVEASGEAGQKSKYGFVFLILSGLFLVLAGLAREALFLFIPVFFIYLLLKKEKIKIIFIFTPVFIILSIFYLPNFLTNRNAYLQLLPVTEISEKLEANDFVIYSEFYPDPYTYHFDRESFLKDYAARRDSQSLIPSLYLQKGAVNNVKADHLSFGRRILLSFLLLADHTGRFISLDQVGGSFIFLLMILGLYYLRKKEQRLFWLFTSLILGVIFMLSFVILAGRRHLIDFGWILALLAALGLLSLLSMIEAYFKLNGKKVILVSGFVLAMVVYSLLLVDHIYWGKVYDDKGYLIVSDYASKINKMNISDKDIVAMESVGDALALNYLSDKSMVVFDRRTIKKLLENGELGSVFKTFGVTHILGYPDDLSKKMTEAAGVTNISSGPGSAVTSEEPMLSMENYTTKNWIMNFIK